jgi:hypothetical protein
MLKADCPSASAFDRAEGLACREVVDDCLALELEHALAKAREVGDLEVILL